MRKAGAASLLQAVRARRGANPGAITDSLFQDRTDGIALLDSDGLILRANARLAELTGAVETTLIWSALPRTASALRAQLLAGEPGSLAVTTNFAGTRRVLYLSLLPVPGQGALLRLSDRTHEQDLKDQLGQAQRLQAVGELAGGIAHDFNNLLTAILGATDDLRARPGLPLQDQADLKLVRDSAERGAGLVRQLLAFSRQQTLQPRVLALNDAVQAAATLLERLLGAGVRLNVKLEEPGRHVRIDPTQLDQVLVNLAVNAAHAMKQGGLLTIATGHALHLRAGSFGGETVPPGRYASLVVEDTGEGIPPDILPRIFEPFFTTKGRTGGTGLGLSTVHGIVRQSGGYMAVSSTPGQGTRFEILFPRHEESPWDTAAVIQAAPAPARAVISRTLLLVDDEAPVRALAERVLRRAGWQVVAATSGEDALELVEAGSLAPALACVISDVQMPGLDGSALVRTLRQAHPGLPAILMSGYAEPKLRADLQAADISFLGKPFSMSDLTHALNGVLGVPRAA